MIVMVTGDSGGGVIFTGDSGDGVIFTGDSDDDTCHINSVYPAASS